MKEVLEYINKLHMFSEGDHVLVGFSGGADSVSLLHTLWTHKETLGIRVSAIHVNHGIRQTAHRDEAFAEGFCKEREIPFYAVKEDVKAYAKEWGLTVEEAGREVRFTAFQSLQEEICANKIALAHHMDDQAETVLFHLCRGTGVKGLGGIYPIRDTVTHPMLCVTRAQIEAYIQAQGLTYVTDESNASNLYARNSLRNEILPLLSEKISPAVSEHIAMTASICQDAQDFLAEALEACKERSLEKTDKGCLIKSSIQKEHRYMQQELVREAMLEVCNSRKDLTYVHVQSVLALMDKQVGRKLDLPYNMQAKRVYEGIEIACDDAVFEEEIASRQELDLSVANQRIALSETKALFIRIFPYDKSANIPQNQYTKWFDYDRINEHLVLRNREAGDYFMIDEQNKQKLKAYFINEKIPADKREEITLLCEGSHVLWAIGYRMSSYYKVTNQTKKILEITFRGEENNG